jgi:hypothetical protein
MPGVVARRADAPLRRAFDRVERAIGAPLEQRLNTSWAAYLLMTVGRAADATIQQIELSRSRLVHLAAIPSRRDIRMLSAQLARLQRGVDEIQQQVEELQEGGLPEGRLQEGRTS